jgi:putative endonuclease
LSKERISLGKQGEDLAAAYLKSHDVAIIKRNYRQKSGEIDIIARDQEWLVFVEVKTRKSLRFGQPFEAVTPKKQAQISRVALDYITRNKLSDQAVRFDVISIVIPKDGKPEIEHLANCFEAAGNFY